MIIVMGIIRADAADLDSLKDAMAAQMAATQAQYDLSADPAAHGRAPHMATFNRAIGGIKIHQISVKAYDVSGVRTLMGE